MPSDQPAQKPTGRTLGEFLDGLGRLSPAELKLLDACLKGIPASIGAARPNGVTDETRIRPGFLRFLLLGGDERAAVHEKGIHLIGAWIDGDIDLEDCRVRVPLWLAHCYVEGAIILRDSELPWMTIENSFTKSIDGLRLRCRGSLYLREGTEVQGSVVLDGASIGGDFECNGSQIGKEDRVSLSCEAIDIQGSAYVGHEGKQGQFQAAGDVNFSGARIKGECDCTGAKFEGSAWFIDAHIGSDMDFSGSEFSGNHEIILSAADIGGRFFSSTLKVD